MKEIWQTIVFQHRSDRLHFWLALSVALLPAAAGILLLGVAGWFITAAAIAGVTGAFLNIFAPSALIRALAILRTAGRYGERVLTHGVTFRFLTRLRTWVFQGVADGEATGALRSGRLLSRLTGDIAALDAIYLRLVVPTVLILSISAGLVAVWWAIALPVLLTGAAFLTIWFLLAGRALTHSDRSAARLADAASEAMRVRASDLAAGRRDLAVYGGLGAAADSVMGASARLEVAEEAEEIRSARLVSLSALLGQVFLVSMLGACVWTVATGLITPAVAVGLVLAAIALPEVVSLILPGLSKLPRTALAAGRMNALQARGSAVKPEDEAGTDNAAQSPVGDVLTFNSVTFRYPGAESAVFQDLSFDVANGELLALAGRSGCGKSTVAALAARLLMPRSGRILLNGKDIQGVPENVLRNAVTVLGQRPYLFHDTVAANLRIANAQAEDAELWQALEQASLADRVTRGEHGLQTVLGEGGIGLSGGEQRRLALARALLKRPCLFILDELTEGLDETSAQDVLDRFMAVRGSASVLMIAHKKAELEAADRILHFAESGQF